MFFKKLKSQKANTFISEIIYLKLLCFYQGLKDTLNHRSVIGIKRMGELNDKPFRDACFKRYPNEESSMKGTRLCSLWQENICDSSWHPFKIVMVDGNPQVCISFHEPNSIKLF